jgi:hypothetical protein
MPQHDTPGARAPAHLDAATELVLEQRQHVVDDDVQVDRPALADRAPGATGSAAR